MDARLLELIKQIDKLKISIRNDLASHEFEQLPQARTEIEKNPKEKIRRFLIRYTQAVHSDLSYIGVKSAYAEFFVVFVLIGLFLLSGLVMYSTLSAKGWENDIVMGMSVVFAALSNLDFFMIYLLDSTTFLCTVIIAMIIALPIMLQDRLLILSADISKMSPYEKVKLYAKLEFQEKMLVKGHEDFRESLQEEEEEQ